MRIRHHSWWRWIWMVLGGGWGGFGGLRHRTAAKKSKEGCTGMLETSSKVSETRKRGAREGMEKCSLRLKDSELRLKSPFSVFCWSQIRRLGVEYQFRFAVGVWWIHWRNKRQNEKALDRKEPVRAPCEQCSFWCVHGPRAHNPAIVNGGYQTVGGPLKYQSAGFFLTTWVRPNSAPFSSSQQRTLFPYLMSKSYGPAPVTSLLISMINSQASPH